MGIEDLAGNEILPSTTGQMLGFEQVPLVEVLPLRSFDFLTQVIRDADKSDGNLFLERYYDGIQEVWEDIQTKIFAIKDLSSVTDIPDEFLEFLKNIVGWTNEPITRRVTDSLTPAALRRLIAASVPLWRQRGPEDAIVDFLELLEGERTRVWNWFDLRWILDEASLDETHQGRDPFLLDLPQDGDDPQRFNIRIVDPGTLDREQVRNVVKLMRPVGERVDISYITFLDQFTTPGDNFQWDAIDGALPLVEDGLAKFIAPDNEGLAMANVAGASAWKNYVAFWRFKILTGGEFFALFYTLSTADTYTIEFRVAANEIELAKEVGGGGSVIETFDFSLQGTLVEDKFYGLRVHIEAEGASNRIQVYVDGELIINVLDADLTAGSVGMGGSETVVDEVEVFLTPLETDEVGLNS